MMRNYDIVIVGGGASGLYLGALIKKHEIKKSVCILERNDRVGKKLSATGNGQGNISNQNISTENYHGADVKFCEYALKNYSLEQFCVFMKDIGVYLKTEPNGRIYPMSKQASSVVDALRFYLESENVDVITDCKVENISKPDGDFFISTSKEKFRSKVVVLCSGGKSAKQFGTDGSAYALAESFGHKTSKLYPSLVQLKCDLSDIKFLKGHKTDVNLFAVEGRNSVTKSSGELLFTDYGVSGNATFQISGSFCDNVNKKLFVEFLPELSSEELLKMLTEKLSKLDYIDKKDVFDGIINKKIGQAIVKRAKSLSAEDLTYSAKNFELKVTGTLGFDYAQVTRGGILTKDVDNKTMESKIVENLFFAGETLDVDGDCGGYNLQWAFSSAYAVASAIWRKGLTGKL